MELWIFTNVQLLVQVCHLLVCCYQLIFANIYVKLNVLFLLGRHEQWVLLKLSVSLYIRHHRLKIFFGTYWCGTTSWGLVDYHHKRFGSLPHNIMACNLYKLMQNILSWSKILEHSVTTRMQDAAFSQYIMPYFLATWKSFNFYYNMNTGHWHLAAIIFRPGKYALVYWLIIQCQLVWI